MKKILISFWIFATTILIGTGCNFTSSDNVELININEMDLFNIYIDTLNSNQKQIKSLQANYENRIPLEINSNDDVNMDDVDLTPLANVLTETQTNLLDKNYKIADALKQTVLENLLKQYLNSGQEYINVYTQIINYYHGDYQNNLEKSVQLETDLQDVYTNVEDLENNIYDQIKEYQQTSDYKVEINSENPLEKINAAIELFTGQVEEIYSAYMNQWQINNPPDEIEQKYLLLKDEREKIVASLELADYSDAYVYPIKQYFDNEYLSTLDAYLEALNIVINDYPKGLVALDSIESYDKVIQSTYEEVIKAHNQIISLTQEILN
ncbi:MAG: hypothetical protein V1898_01290 [Patescibacteria group bacterium]